MLQKLASFLNIFENSEKFWEISDFFFWEILSIFKWKGGRYRLRHRKIVPGWIRTNILPYYTSIFHFFFFWKINYSAKHFTQQTQYSSVTRYRNSFFHTKISRPNKHWKSFCILYFVIIQMLLSIFYRYFDSIWKTSR